MTTAAAAEKVADDAPEATVTDAGTERTAVLLLVNPTAVPPEGDAWFNVTVHVEVPPELRVVGVQATLVSSTGARTESNAEEELPFSVALTVADCGEFGFAAAATNVPVDVPDGTMTEAGTETAAVLVLVRATAVPPDGAV